MGVVGRLDQYASMLAYEFDDYSMSENLVTATAIDFNYPFSSQIISTANDVAPNGLTVLCKHDLTGANAPFLNCRADITLSSGNTYTMSMYLKGTTSFSASFAFVGETTNEIYANTANITTTWQRFTLTFTLVATQTASRLQVFFATQGEGKVISLWGAQLERGSVATDYTSRPSGTAISRVLPATTNTNITGLGTYYSSGFDENVGFTTFLSANISAPYDLVYDEFGGTLFGAGQGRYMRQNTDKSVIVYNEIDEIGFTPSYRIFSSATSVNEGSSVTFTANANNVETGTTLYYNITGSVGIASADFTNNSLSGSLVISGSFDLGFGSTTLTLANDVTTEGTETFNMNLRTGSISGTVVATSSTITVNDTSIQLVTSATLVYDLDAANFSALPANGSTVNGYTITMTNANSSMSWNSANGGVFRKSTNNATDQLIGGPNYNTGTQAYTVFMAYKLSVTAQGRLLNTNEASPDWLMGSWFNGTAYMNVYYPGNTVNLGSDVADTNWHFIWGTSNGSNLSQLYIATNTAPSGTYKTGAFVGGFNQLRLFGRYSNATTSSEVQTADIGFVKVYNGVLSLADIQTLHSTYKARFGY
jgi:hypothetical protein